MFGDSKRVRLLVGGGAGSTLCIAMASVIGIIPGVDESTGVRMTDVRATDFAAMEKAPEVAPAMVLQELLPTAPVTVPATAAPTPTTTPANVTEVSAPEPDLATAAEPVVEAPAPAESPSPVLAARRVPAPSEVEQAIEGMSPYIKYKSGLVGLLSKPPRPTAAQVDELGDKVCTAFDQGQTYDQVKATGLEMARDNPWVTISDAGADYVVRTGVALYCPDYSTRLA